MAIFNITCNPLQLKEFRTDNVNIHIDTINLKISQIQITNNEWQGNL